MEDKKLVGESGDSEEMSIDEALEETGPCGRFQISVQLLFMLLMLTVGYHSVVNYFIAHDPPWECTAETNATFCRENAGKHFAAGSVNFSRRCGLNRSEWKYATSKKYSIVTEFDLICDKAPVAAFASGMFFIGGFFGCVLSGLSADLYGRKVVLIIVIILTFCSSIGCSFATSVWELTLLRSFLGAVVMSSVSIGFIILSEFVVPSYRTVSGNMYQLTFCLSQMLLTGAAYVEREWRQLQFYTTFPVLLPLVLAFFVPKSPRWLQAKKRDEDALRVIKRIGKYNRKMAPSTLLLKPLDVSGDKKYTYFDLFRNCRVFLLTIVQCFMWMAVAFVYYAIALESSNLGGDMYQAFVLSALADLPGNFAALYACNRFGRKKTVLGGIFLSGILIGALALVPTSYSHRYIVNVTLAMLAKFLIDMAFNAIYIWSFELFPTVLRSQGMSLCIGWERLGAFASPFLTTVLQNVNYVLPYVIMCVISVSCSLAGLFLPETNRLPTRETFEDFFAERKGYLHIITEPPPKEEKDGDFSDST